MLCYKSCWPIHILTVFNPNSINYIVHLLLWRRHTFVAAALGCGFFRYAYIMITSAIHSVTAAPLWLLSHNCFNSEFDLCRCCRCSLTASWARWMRWTWMSCWPPNWWRSWWTTITSSSKFLPSCTARLRSTCHISKELRSVSMDYYYRCAPVSLL